MTFPSALFKPYDSCELDALGIELDAVFEKEGLAEPLTIQPGRTRPFLIAVSEYSPPRD